VVHGRPRRGAERHVIVVRTHRLEQRRVDDPHELEFRFVDQSDAAGDLVAGGSEEAAGLVGLARGEEDAVAVLGGDCRREACELRLGQVLGDGAPQCAVLADEHVRKALGSALFRPVLPRVERLARLARTTWHDDGAHILRLEDPERGLLKVVGELSELEAEPQVRLVGAEARHRVGERQARDGQRNLVADERPQLLDDLLAKSDHVVLVHEGHLDVKLCELGLAIGPEVLVAVAAGDLVVLLHACHHEQLLEQLRRLRQGVPRPRRKAGGHQEVAGTLGSRVRQRGSLDLEEVVALEHAARGLVDLGAQHHRLTLARATQVEVAVLEACLLANGDVLIDRERRGSGFVEHH